MGETGDSGHDLGFDGGGEEGKCSAISERFKGWDRGVVPDHGSGLIIGDFAIFLLP